YDRPDFEGAKYVMTPPLRTRAHQEALWRGLRTDDLQVVSTDHCPFCFNERPWGLRSSKQQGRDDFSKIPNGAPGVETRLPLIFDGGVRQHGLSLNRFVELTATTPAKLFGLFPRKGTIAVGSDADLVLFDPQEGGTMRGGEGHTRVDYTLFEGHQVTGRVKKVFLRGQQIVDGAEWLGKEGMGEFVRRGGSGKAETGGGRAQARGGGMENSMEGGPDRKTLILGRTDMMGLVTPAEYVSCVEQAYRMHGEGRYFMEPKGHIVLDKYPGEWEAMPSYIEEPEAAACKWVSIREQNRERFDLPTVFSILIHTHPETGFPLAICDGSFHTVMRTGAAAAVSVRWMARPDAQTLAIVGAGHMAQGTLATCNEVVKWRDVRA